MLFKHHIEYIAALFLSVFLIFPFQSPSSASPARPGWIKVRQPDGSVVKVRTVGDEFGHYSILENGTPVLMASDGYLHYADYSSDGTRTDSGLRLSEATRSGGIVPVASIASNAAKRRKMMTVKPLSNVGSSTVKAIVLLAQFADLQFKYTSSNFENLLNEEDYDFEGSTGSVKQYLSEQFAGTKEFVFDLGPVVTLSKGYKYYGEDDDEGNDLRAEYAAAEACRLSDPQVDFSQYEHIFIIYAGGTPADYSADDDHIWPFSWDFYSAGIQITLDGRELTNFSMTSELISNQNDGSQIMTTIGTFCHEFSHSLGLHDLYDTDYSQSGGSSKGVYRSTSLMDAGNYNNNGRTPPCYNAVELEMLGISTAEPLLTGELTLPPLSSEKRFYRLDSDTEGEYYLFECRATEGWDKYVGGSGMLVYHVDKSDNDSGYSYDQDMIISASDRWYFNEINANPSHMCCEIKPAANVTRDDISNIFFPYPSTGTDTFSPSGTPSFSFWDGSEPSVSLKDIRKAGTSVSFTVSGPLNLDSVDAHQDAAILNWHTEMSNMMNKSTILKLTDLKGGEWSVSVKAYDSGKFSYTFENLEPDTEYTVSLRFDNEDDDVQQVSATFSTKRYAGLPFIYLNETNRGSSGLFTSGIKIPLRVYNAEGAKNVSWYLDNELIAPAGDGYYAITEEGVLKAVIDYKDGSREIIAKTIKIK